jgi:hypothetical protein
MVLTVTSSGGLLCLVHRAGIAGKSLLDSRWGVFSPFIQLFYRVKRDSHDLRGSDEEFSEDETKKALLMGMCNLSFKRRKN